ncbi:MAG TPA: hypothetical protein VFG69_15710 [Nannocystaceae bacterium]|nr:hypothetical protein [Nannocystaceae bacterium]
MSTRDRDPPLDDDRPLDGLVDAAERSAEYDILGHEPPAFAAIVARAHRMNPARVSADDVEDASGVHRAVPRAIVRDVPMSEEEAAELDEFVEAARAEAEADVDAWHRNGLPAWRRPAPARVRRAVVALGVLGLAAGLVLAIGWLQSWSASVRARERDGDQALAGVETRGEVHEATRLADVEPDKAPPRRRPRARDEGPAPAPESAFVVPDELAPLEPPVSPAAPLVAPPAVPGRVAGTVPSPEPQRSPRPPRSASSRIEAKAQAAIKTGELGEADRLYRDLIHRGGRSATVELAYADRFTIARQQGGVAKRVALWREYLRKFPRGRFADDARAGLCRVAAASDKPRCWAAYVDDFPAGAYRAHAERWSSP